ncbi:MAG: hypothetical protein H5T45_02585 [Thermoplasmatales archaeon]|nr:hypothetical protein [Thermoplasmatales archaeon]
MNEIETEIEKFDWLIDEETARLLLMEKNKLIERKKIKEAEGNVAIDAKIESKGKIYEKKAIAVIGDESGHCVLKLWDENKKILNYLNEGDCVRIANGIARTGIYGLEINVGKFGSISKIDKKIETKIKFEEGDGIFCLKGKIEKKFPTNLFIDENYEKFSRKIIVDGKEIYLFDERAKDVSKINEGSDVILLWIYKRNGKICATSFSKIIQKQHSESH